jgi:hypothetical protein
LAWGIHHLVSQYRHAEAVQAATPIPEGRWEAFNGSRTVLFKDLSSLTLTLGQWADLANTPARPRPEATYGIRMIDVNKSL